MTNDLLNALAEAKPASPPNETIQFVVKRIGLAREADGSMLYQLKDVRTYRLPIVGVSRYPARLKRIEGTPDELLADLIANGYDSLLGSGASDNQVWAVLGEYAADHNLDPQVSRRLSEAMNVWLACRKGAAPLSILHGAAS